jgi:hypothetical protein
MEFY